MSKRGSSNACKPAAQESTVPRYAWPVARAAAIMLACVATMLAFVAPALGLKASHSDTKSRSSHSTSTKTRPSTSTHCTTHRRVDTHGKVTKTCEHKPAASKPPSPALVSAPSSSGGATAAANSSLGAPLVEQPQVAPTVSSITPASGAVAGGTSVKIKGTEFVTGASVWIGAKAASVEVVSETEIKATTSAGRGKDEVVVEDEHGVTTGGPSFTFVAPPKVTSISPAEGTTAGGTAVKIKGTGFGKGTKVKIGSGEATSVTVSGETEISAKTPAGSAGEAEVVVEDEVAKSSESNPSFTYVTPPTVASVEPADGSTLGGTAIVIKGTGLTDVTKVRVGSVEATGVEVESATEVKATTAAGAAGKDEVVVSYANGVASTGGASFTYVAPPSVSSVTPAEGSTAGGTAIVIKGKGFLKAGAKVKVGGGEVASMEVVSETEVKAKTATGAAGKDEVVVEDEFGKSTTNGSFTYVTPATVEEIEPATGSTAGGTAVVIKGTEFAKTATVTIGKAATNVEWVSATELKAKTAAETAGEDEVVVENAAGVPSLSGPKFTFIAPPTVTSVSPADGSTLGGTTVVIKGTGFVEPTKVMFGSAEAASVEFVSATEVKAKTAAGSAGKVAVAVEDSKGKSTTNGSFTFVAPPKVTSISPAEGTTAGGTAVKIKGTGFMKGSSVTIGKAARDVTIVSETEITATTPAFAAGETEVIVEDEYGSSSGGAMFTFIE